MKAISSDKLKTKTIVCNPEKLDDQISLFIESLNRELVEILDIKPLGTVSNGQTAVLIIYHSLF